MSKQMKLTAVFVSFLLLTSLATAGVARPTPTPRPRNFQAGAVYVMTNQTTNAVAVFLRTARGALVPAGEFPTGGAGDPVAQPQDPPVDPLASQGALILGEGNKFLFAVNAGSNQISVLRIASDGLTIADVVDSGGVRPISLALHENLLYVLNEGATPNITGFTVGDDGTLTPLSGSTQPLIGGMAADPAEVSFNPDGTVLVVTEKMGNRLDTYTIDENGLPSAPIDNPSNGMTPFGFAFKNQSVVVSETFGGAPNQAAVSSYSVPDNGTLSVISGSVPNFQTASCWVVIINNGRFAFVSNTLSGTIASYRIADDGTLTLINGTAANTGPMSAPRDMALSNNSRFLYVQIGGGTAVASFRVGNDGALTPVEIDGGLPFGAQGIAAK